MAETIARWIVSMVAIYLAAGIAFAVPFVLRGIERIDPVARRAGWGFRCLVAPGVVALWPLLARRWLQAMGERRS